MLVLIPVSSVLVDSVAGVDHRLDGLIALHLRDIAALVCGGCSAHHVIDAETESGRVLLHLDLRVDSLHGLVLVILGIEHLSLLSVVCLKMRLINCLLDVLDGLLLTVYG